MAWFLIPSTVGVETEPTNGSSFEHSREAITSLAAVVFATVGSLNSLNILTTELIDPTAALEDVEVFDRYLTVNFVFAGPMPSLSVPIKLDGSNEVSVT